MSKLNILQRLNAVQKVVTYIQKETVQGMPYAIVSHDKVTAKVRPEMVKNGVLYYPVNMTVEQSGNRTQMLCDVRFSNIDDPTDFIDVATAGYGIDTQDKGPGKAESYAVKFALLKVLGLETGMDADLDNVDHHEEEKEPPKYARLVTGIKNQPDNNILTEWLKSTDIKADFHSLPEKWQTKFGDEVTKRREEFQDEPNILLGG